MFKGDSKKKLLLRFQGSIWLHCWLQIVMTISNKENVQDNEEICRVLQFYRAVQSHCLVSHFYLAVSFRINPSCLLMHSKVFNTMFFAGDEQIQSVKVVWEDRLWNPSALILSTKEQFKYVNGELVVEVTVKNSASKTRGQAWEVVKEACLPIMETLDWQRSIPYSIQEIHQNLGIEAAKEVLLQV